MAEKIVVFGAGATGRGHVGLLAWQAGFEMVFVDQKMPLVEALRQKGHYTVKLYGEGLQEIAVSGYRVYHSQERAAIADEIRDARLVLTAVFDQNLPDVAKTIALGIAACARAGRTAPLNCIACENMMDSSTKLGQHVRTHLGGADLDWCEAHAAFPDCMISRVVPRPEPDPLVIVAEDYNEWTARAEAFRGEKPAALSALELVDNQTARLERKLFIHNGGHAVCGYLAFHRGHRYIHEAVADPEVAGPVVGALDELGEVVRRKWGFSAESIDEYKTGLLPARRRRRNARRGAARGPRPDPQALAARTVGGPRHAGRSSTACRDGHIVHGIVAALRYSHPKDPQSVVLAEQLAQQGLSKVLENVCGIASKSPLASEIESAWKSWENRIALLQ